MPRAVWSGSISFGLVNVPVKLYASVHDHTVHFHQVDKGTGSRIRHEKVAEETGKRVDKDDLQLGYDMGSGGLVVMDPDELAALQPAATRTVDITDFVDLGDVDPVYYQHTYWLAPDGEAATRAYRLLVVAMTDRGKVGIGTMVMRNKQYLAAVRPRDQALALSTMRFHDEILDRSSIDAIPRARSRPAAKELQLANQIVDSMSSAWEPGRYRDTYTAEVQALIKRHAKGGDVVVEEEPATQKESTTDLMEALQASLDRARAKKPSGKARASSSRSKTKPKSAPSGGRTRKSA
jgi:DNA end-binding protein Ku